LTLIVFFVQQWWHGILAAVIGSLILSVVVVLNSRGATRYHVGFPVYIRSSAGVSGSKLFIVVRASVAIIYFATQSFYGGMLTSVALRCIFGSSWENIPNTLPASAGITSKNLLAFFIFWIVQFPVMFVHPTVMRHLFVVKAVATTAGLFGVFGWAVHTNGGSLGSFEYNGTIKVLSGSALVWPMIQAINSVMAALCPILVNQPDVARYATSPRQATWSQSTGILLSKVLVMFLSCATTSAASEILGKTYWNVWDLYGSILTAYWGPAARAGIFFASLVSCPIPWENSKKKLMRENTGHDSGGDWYQCWLKLAPSGRRHLGSVAALDQHCSWAGHLCPLCATTSSLEDHC
jgi:NCS1 family nucleobase:cation symporter-1